MESKFEIYAIFKCNSSAINFALYTPKTLFLTESFKRPLQIQGLYRPYLGILHFSPLKTCSVRMYWRFNGKEKCALYAMDQFDQPIGRERALFDFVCFVALRPKSTAMVMAGQSVHLTTLFPGQA